MPDHLSNLERTQTEIDVIHTTQKSPYREKNFIGSYIAILLSVDAVFVGFLLPVTSLPLIELELGASPNSVWVALGWILLSAISFVLLGRLSDIFGRRWFFTGSTLVALVGSIVGATAKKTDTLIAASILLGLGSAGQLSFNVSLGELVPMRHRFAAASIIFLTTLPFSGLGPYIARLMIVSGPGGWRGIYYLAIGLNAASSICWLVFYHPPDFERLHRNRTMKQELRDLDVGGIFLYVSGFFLFLLGLAWGGTVYPWTSASVITPLVVGFVVFVGFILYEIHMDLRRPLIPMHLFANKDFVVTNILSAVGGVVYYTVNTLFPVMVTALYTTDVLRGGLITSSFGAGVVVGQFMGSLIAVPGGKIKAKLVLFSCGLCAFAAALSGVTHSQNIGIALASLGGVMTGLLEAIVSITVTISIPDQSEIGAAGGVFGSIRAAAGVLATAIYASVLKNKASAYIMSDVIPAIVKAGLPVTSVPSFLLAIQTGSLPALRNVKGVSPEIIAVGLATIRESYAQSFRIVWLGTLAFGILAVIASLFTSNIEDKLGHDVIRRLDGSSIETNGQKEKALTG